MPKGIRKDGRTKSLKGLPPEPKKILRNQGRPKKYTDEWIEEEAEALLKWIEKDEGIYLGDFTYERGYSRARLTEFAEKSKCFSDALENARHWQERKLLRGGLLKGMDATQVRYTMARLCGDIWKNSFDREDSDRDITLNINVNRLQD